MSTNLQKLIDYFSNILKIYGNFYGKNDKLYLEAIEFYKNGLSDWHGSNFFPDAKPIEEKRKIQISNIILDFINLINKRTKKESCMKKSILKSLIREVIRESKGGPDDPEVLYAEYMKERSGEEPFMLNGQKFQYVQAKYPNGVEDIGVYAFSGDIVYGYAAFRQMYNLPECINLNSAKVIAEAIQGGSISIMAIIDNEVFPHTSEELEEIAEKYHLRVKYVGDSTFGTETLRRYRMLFFGPQGQIDSFIDELASEKGIDFIDIKAQPVHEVAPPEFKPGGSKKKLYKKIKGQYSDEPEKAYATMWKIHNQNKKEIEESAWQSAKIYNRDENEWRNFATKVAKGDKDLEYAFHMAISTAEDNALIDPSHNAEGAYTSDHYKVDVDLYKGKYRITRINDIGGGKLKEANKGKVLKWKDGTEVELDQFGNPVGYKNLGWANSGVKIPEANDWLRYYVSGSGTTEAYLSPRLKLFYKVDSSG